MDALDVVIAAYIKETDVPLSIDEVKEAVQHWQPLTNEGGVIGVFGYDVIPSDVYSHVGILKLIYVFPEHRKSFKPYVRAILLHIKGLGVNHIEVWGNSKIHNWMRKHLNSKPIIYIHEMDVDETLGRIG